MKNENTDKLYYICFSTKFVLVILLFCPEILEFEILNTDYYSSLHYDGIIYFKKNLKHITKKKKSRKTPATFALFNVSHFSNYKA